ncbi:ferrochelatase [Candidatus Magnetomonas plexicatena]|uniref:ferrochelatase n=1 Tax=Candidatus Magnetomonas plexicatena TaxID=2552947 RepID=UPI001C77BA19|nr:ferrochelatase [Nitrospirales bacterium LBB_01]
METIGVLLINMGGPENLEAVRPFLYNLFSDRFIIKLGPAFMQKPIAAMIATLRCGKTMAMYSKIGGGSPIGKITALQAEKLEAALASSSDDKNAYKVFVVMRYTPPFIGETLQKAVKSGIKRFIALTLYPHECLATTGSAFEVLRTEVERLGVSCKFINSYADNELYIKALVENINGKLLEFQGNCRDILFSAHGLPQYFVDEGDPYVNELTKTIEKIKEQITGYNYHLSYQSRSGPVKWIEPATEDKIRVLADEGVKNLLIVPISFVSDHIETLYEIDILYKDLAKEHGITMLRPKALNDGNVFIQALAALVLSNTHF